MVDERFPGENSDRKEALTLTPSASNVPSRLHGEDERQGESKRVTSITMDENDCNDCDEQDIVRGPQDRNLLQFSPFLGMDDDQRSPHRGRFKRVMTGDSPGCAPPSLSALDSNMSSDSLWDAELGSDGGRSLHEKRLSIANLRLAESSSGENEALDTYLNPRGTLTPGPNTTEVDTELERPFTDTEGENRDGERLAEAQRVQSKTERVPSSAGSSRTDLSSMTSFRSSKRGELGGEVDTSGKKMLKGSSPFSKLRNGEETLPPRKGSLLGLFGMTNGENKLPSRKGSLLGLLGKAGGEDKLPSRKGSLIGLLGKTGGEEKLPSRKGSLLGRLGKPEDNVLSRTGSLLRGLGRSGMSHESELELTGTNATNGMPMRPIAVPRTRGRGPNRSLFARRDGQLSPVATSMVPVEALERGCSPGDDSWGSSPSADVRSVGRSSEMRKNTATPLTEGDDFSKALARQAADVERLLVEF